MSEASQLIDTLKQELRKQRINYRQVAKGLGISETSVKRLFSKRTFSLDRVEKICDMLNIGFFELATRMEQNVELTTELTLAQEKELVSDEKLLLLAFFLVNKHDFDNVIEHYDISEHEGIRLLARLDRMKILELQPGNRVKLLISPNFRWIPKGPIERYFEERVQTEFFESSFDRQGEIRLFSSGMLTRDASLEAIRKIKHLTREFNELIRESETSNGDAHLGTSMLIAMRPWEAGIFKELRRPRAHER